MKRQLWTSAVAFALVTGCASPPPSQVLANANAVLSRVGVFAEDSFYSCLINAYNQGLSPTQARDLCATKLLEDDKKGFGPSVASFARGTDSFFDPAKITAACNSGDPSRGQSAGGSSGMHTTPGRGINTWGEKSNTSKGLSQEQSDQQKADAVAHAENETDKFFKLEEAEEATGKALAEAKKTGDQVKIDKAKAEDDAAKKAALDQAAEALRAIDKAKEDPNQKPLPQSRPAAEDSPCAQALAAAQELLRECHRTEWKDFRCQQLQARMNQCPDPALILVDPDQGYTCGAKVDPEAARKAWIARCEQLVKVGPDTADPCLPPAMDSAFRFGRAKIGDVCGNPYAQIDPNNDPCSTVTIGKQFGAIDIQALIVLALNKIGGPIVVIPRDPRPLPHPGADPRPGPKP